jgi:competence ComEA-like helix-hairpin-helix protein
MKSNKKTVAVWFTGILVIGLLFVSIAGGQTKVPTNSPAKVDLNKATAEQLSKCPGFNSALAKATVEYRAKSGPFKTPEDLLKIKGITKEILDKINPKMDKGSIFVVPNASDEDEEEPSLKPSKC